MDGISNSCPTISRGGILQDRRIHWDPCKPCRMSSEDWSAKTHEEIRNVKNIMLIASLITTDIRASDHTSDI